jgi:hypothetical protein
MAKYLLIGPHDAAAAREAEFNRSDYPHLDAHRDPVKELKEKIAPRRCRHRIRNGYSAGRRSNFTGFNLIPIRHGRIGDPGFAK